MPYPIHLSLQRQHLLTRLPARAWRRAVRDLVAVQAQYEAAGALGLNARVEGFTQAQVTRALYTDRTLIKMWALRGTLHYVLPEDWKLFVAVYGPWYIHRVERNVGWGLSFAERQAWVYPAILEALADGPLTYKQVLDRLQQTVGHRHPNLKIFFDSWGGILGGMCLLGLIVLVDSAGAQTRVARADRWLAAPDLAPFEGTPAQAMAVLLKRYLKTYGPASEADFQLWTIAGTETRREAWAALRPQLREAGATTDSGKPLYILRADAKALNGPRPDLPVRLLPKFDSVVLMHKDKARVLDPAHYKKVFRIAAQVEATLLVNGQVAGTWRHARQGRTLQVSLFPFGRLTRPTLKQVEAEAQRAARFFGLDETALLVA